MRTQSLLLAAALGLASAATSQAEVYSVNAVGFVNKTLEANEFYLLANPLKVGNNLLTEVLPTVPNGTLFFKFIGGKWERYLYDDEWLGPDAYPAATQTFAPGEGAFVKVPVAHTITFVGEVSQGALSINIPSGFSVRASQVPQSLPLSFDPAGGATLGFPTTNGDTVWLYKRNPDGYHRFIYDDEWLDGSGPNVPKPEVAESFFVKKSVQADWARTFSVNP